MEHNTPSIKAFYIGALLHDAGKIGIKEHILNKPAALSQSEFQEMQRHPVIGAEIIKNVKMLKDGDSIILHHHERFDGGGYPQGIKEGAIPEGARIIGVADAFDAMTSDRPYRRALTSDEAVGEMHRCSGSQFDPRIVEAFIKVLPSITLTEEDSGVLQAMQEAAATAEEPQTEPGRGEASC